MKAVFRVDATSEIGIGHVMRCIALAQAWQDAFGEVAFASRCESSRLRELILKEGFHFFPMERVHPDPADLMQTLKYLEGQEREVGARWAVLDGYHFTPEYMSAIRSTGLRLLVLDDTAHLPFYDADILLNQNVYAPQLEYFCDAQVLKLLGSNYVLLRREFLHRGRKAKKIPDKAQNILVTLGGSDPHNTTITVLRAVNELNDHDLRVQVVLGPANPHLTIIKEMVCNAANSGGVVKSGVKLIFDADMSRLMDWADMAVSAGGSTCWELAFMGVPFAAIILADNQNEIVHALAKAGIAYNGGWFYELSEKRMKEILSALIYDKKRRAVQSEKGMSIVDGLGAKRIVEKMFAS